MGAAVVSERSAVDPMLDDEYHQAVVFAGDPHAIRTSGEINNAAVLKGQTRPDNAGGLDQRNWGYVETPDEMAHFDSVIDAALHLARNTTARREVERRAWTEYQLSAANTTLLGRAMAVTLADLIG
jgi:hypothetical protein